MIKKKCSIDGCTRPSRSRGLCQTHYVRLHRSGTTDDPKAPEGKTKHPMYITWIAAKKGGILCDKWQDFWKFVADISPIPEGNYRIYRAHTNQPYSKDNCQWRRVKDGKLPEETSRQFDARKQRIRYKPGGSKGRQLKRIYGLTLEQYHAMHDEQKGVCAICERPETVQDGRTGAAKALSVDHCHDSKKVRGLLCTKCNTAIGKFDDDPELLMRAIEYLKKHQTD